MEKKKKLGTIVAALLLSYAVSGAFLVLLAAGLWKFQLSETIVHIGLLILYGVSVFVGGFYIGKKKRHRKFLWGMVVGILYIILWGSACIVTNGPFPIINQNTLTIAAICILSGILGGMIA